MNGTLNLTAKIVAFGDTTASSNPRLKYVDWSRDMTAIPVSDPQSESHTLATGTSKTLFDGTLASAIDGTTTFSIALSTIDSSRYRITHTGGTAPGFRTGRGLTLNGVAVTFVVNANQTVTVSVPVGPDFASLQVGDEVFIPHTTTGDSASPVSVLNAGFWSVLGKASSTSITLVRPAGTTFEAVAQTATLTANTQFRGYSAAGLQIADFVDISEGFHLSTRKSFEVLTVTDSFVEFVSTVALPAESGVVPTASGMAFFSECKRIVYIETDQDVIVRVNGDTGRFQRLSPIDPSRGDVAPYFKIGPTWLLTIVNVSPTRANVTLIHCE